MKEKFKDINFGPERLKMIETSNTIIEALRAQGYVLTLRQLYYQLVSRDIIANKQTEYKRLGDILNDARLAGLVDWSSIEDRTRNLVANSHWTSPGDIIESAAQSYQLDKWEDQENHVEVWVEKDALVGVLEKACRPLDVAFFSCRGYTSQSELYSAGKRLARTVAARKTPVIIHLGDHDPSGIDMTRDITDRLSLFARRPIVVERIALNRDQIEQYDPPPNPAKITDSRFAGYQREHGGESWELDALDPAVIDALIVEKVNEFRDQGKWDSAVEKEASDKSGLQWAAERWEEVSEFLETN